MIVKPSYASGMIVIDVPWGQDNPNDMNRQNGVIQCDLGQSGRLKNKKNGISRIGAV